MSPFQYIISDVYFQQKSENIIVDMSIPVNRLQICFHFVFSFAVLTEEISITRMLAQAESSDLKN